MKHNILCFVLLLLVILFATAENLIPLSTISPLQSLDDIIAERRDLIANYLINPSEQFIIDALSGLDVITEIQAATEDHDPNGNLHKQGGYTSAIYLTTKYLNPETVFGYSIIDKGTEAGGQIEVYETAEIAESRNQYLTAISGFINPGSHIVLGSMVIRTSNKLLASKQKELERLIVLHFIDTLPAVTLVPSLTPTITQTFTPSPTPTLIPTITPTCTPIPTTEPNVTLTPVYGIANFSGDTGIIVREKPSVNSNIISSISNNTNVEVTGHIVNTNGEYWISIRTTQGWNGWVRLNDMILPTPVHETDEKADAYQKLYDQASALMQSGDYGTAKIIFDRISDFADSAEMIKECDYQLALSLEENGSYVEAMVAFTLLGDYKDSSDHVLQNALKIKQP